MSTPSSNPDDLLSRAVDAMRQVPVPEGPSEEVVSRTLAALMAADRVEAPIFHFRRRRLMIAMMKIAAVVVVAAGGLSYLGAPPSGGTMVAFAATVQTLREAQGYSFRMTLSGPDQKKLGTMKTYFKAPGVSRSEQEGGQVVISNTSQGKTLMLDPSSKSALLIESKPHEKPKENSGVGLVESFRKLEASDGVPAGEKEIGGVKARGFRVKKLHDEMVFWIDPNTKLPLLVETTSQVQGKEIRTTLSEFVINPDVDEALFSTEPPPGYTLRRTESDVFGGDPEKFLDIEEAAVRLLRLYTEKSGGTFPTKLDDFNMFNQFFPKDIKKSALPDPERLRTVQTILRFMMATRELKEGFGYKPDGVKLGDADTIILWYKPKGANLHRAIYGDLHGADVTANKLPEPQKP
ncbi:hypothetical protein V5E97_05035 [Singulisphaera sp. Ch08]|uniref:DUF2092 domain-containing protein n=1 Tax=Singulisphaera sp. Ch08 TaxID=3120278 RepID=A0AAU7CK53_9BACT